MAVTKSGTNQFRGSLYNVRRNSDWNANSKANNSNGVPKPVSKAQDIGFSIGGPIGKPGGHNKLFFFFAEEFNPATAGGTQQTFRLPTALERQGDFSQTTDNLGNPYPYIKDPQACWSVYGDCSAAITAVASRTAACSGGYPPTGCIRLGLNILKMYPLPNNQSTTIGTNHQFIQPTFDTLLYQPALRLDYQVTQGLRVSFKYQGNNMSKRVTLGSLPGWNDAIVPIPNKGTEAVTVNYNINASTFLEGTYGRAGNQLAGCGGLPVNDVSDSRTTGLANLPLIFPDANVINPDYYAYEILQSQNPPYWDGTRIFKVPAFRGGIESLLPPEAAIPRWVHRQRHLPWLPQHQHDAGRRDQPDEGHGPPHVQDRVLQQPQPEAGEQRPRRHQLRDGQLLAGHRRRQPVRHVVRVLQRRDRELQLLRAGVQVRRGDVQVYDNREAYVQDNWKVKSNWSIDYGVRFVHAVPQHDALLQSGNFLPDKWVQSAAPVLYVPGCVGNTATCAGSNRSAKNPLTGQLLGPNSALAIGTLVPNSGPERNGLFQSGKEIADTTYLFPKLNVGPRFGTAYDISGTQRFVLRGSLGIYFDRPRGGNAQALVGNTFVSTLQTLRYSQLQSLGGLADAVARAAHGLPVQQQAPDLDGMEHRHPDADSLVHVR